MTYDSKLAASLSEKYRADALRVFISGTKKSLSDILFSEAPKDLPSALALAQEVESNHERYQFACSFAKSREEKAQRNEQRQQMQPTFDKISPDQVKTPFYKHKPQYNSPNVKQELPQPMDVDSSSRFRQLSQYQNQGSFSNAPNQNQVPKRPNSGTARYTGPKQQRINHLSQDENPVSQSEEEYQAVAESEVADLEDEYQLEEVNFLDIDGNMEMLPFVERTIAGKTIKLLIDTGASKNYIKPIPELKNVTNVQEEFKVKSLHGCNSIENKCLMHLFNTTTTFFLLPSLSSFDGIIGLDLLNKINATLDFKNNILKTETGSIHG